ncbi:TetR/AcrR family transcriptional regulator [Nocardioides sp. R-C-SC26]|uniref:TetR/AcrR family transcriptional regulator n=1 Tax=Nocardioides sp. R-C-SC26 TaxID=2870414 RepID=UPI001E539533|nr:TetR/AcrR family transcriptional regulator [Nocardioides sp. R-C-SC26]
MSDDALLDAAVAQFALTGVRRTSADDIARRAGVNRTTLYRRLGTMDLIAQRAFLRETERVLTQIMTDVPEIPPAPSAGFDPASNITAFFSVTLDAVRGNELLRQLSVLDRDETLVGLTERAGAIIALSADLVAARVVALRAHVGNPRTDDVAAVAQTLARITQSLLLTPDGPPDLATEPARRAYCDAVITPLVLGV